MPPPERDLPSTGVTEVHNVEMGSDSGSLPCPTIVDLEMLDSTAAAERRRPSLSTSLSDFALFPSSSSAPSSPSSASTPQDDGASPFFRRFRRASILAAHPIIADFDIVKPSSPLAMSSHTTPHFTFSSEKMMMAEDNGNSSSSGSNSNSNNSNNNHNNNSSSSSRATPSFLFDIATTTANAAAPPSTPPPRPSGSASTLTVDPPDSNPPRRRFSLPPKPARLLDLRSSELRSPIDSELKSEAQFQRLLAACSHAGPPFGKHLPRTARAWADRGRFPEEAGGDDEYSSAGSASDEGEEELTSIGASATASASVTGTPSGSVSGCGDDHAMTIDTAIVGPFMMDVDIPSAHSAVSSPTQWRQTPPPTSGGVRANKRKLDDRYDPYPNVTKRRAVSPSVHGHHLHSHSHSHPHLHSHHHRPRSGSITATSPISIPVPNAHSRSVTSSPILRPTSSPILRPTSFPGNSFQGKSPTVRPLARLTMRNGSDTERERERSQRGVDGAGEAVSSLSIT